MVVSSLTCPGIAPGRIFKEIGMTYREQRERRISKLIADARKAFENGDFDKAEALEADAGELAALK